MTIKLVDGLPIHPTLRHPRTGQPLRAVGVLSGKPVWPVIGASDDDDSSGDNDAGEDSEDNDTGDGSDDGDKGSEKPGKSAESEELKAAKEELARVRKRLSASDKNKAAAEKRLRELENKGKPEDEVAKQELEEAKERASKASESVRKLAVTNAFLIASQKAKVNWFDVKIAQAAIESDDIEIDEEGNVTGMDEAVKALAKAKGFLVDRGKSDKEDEEEDKKNGPSGSAVGSRKKPKGSNTLDENKLREMFPALKN